jgi:hypothetical protein
MSKAVVVFGLMLSVALMCTSVSSAQNGIKFGVLGGLNFADADIEKLPLGLAEDNVKKRLGIAGGAFGNWP